MPLYAQHPARHSVGVLEQLEPWPAFQELSVWLRNQGPHTEPVREHTGRPEVETGWLWPHAVGWVSAIGSQEEGCWEFQGRLWGGLQCHVLEGQLIPSSAQVPKNAGRSAVWSGFPERSEGWIGQEAWLEPLRTG